MHEITRILACRVAINGLAPAAARRKSVPMTAEPAAPPHPRGVDTLFFTEMGERMSFYGMRALIGKTWSLSDNSPAPWSFATIRDKSSPPPERVTGPDGVNPQ